MCINVDLAGTEQFCTDVALDLPELGDLYNALEGLSEMSIRSAHEYFDEFYRILESPESARRVFVRSCPIG